MEIANLNIKEQEFGMFLNLRPKDKIEFLYDASSNGLDLALSKINPQIPISPAKQIVNDLFQDTVYEEMIYGDDKLNVLILHRSIHINSSSLSWIRRIILKLWMDGHIVLRNLVAKKIPGIDKYRYYRCYDIIGTVPPICLS